MLLLRQVVYDCWWLFRPWTHSSVCWCPLSICSHSYLTQTTMETVRYLCKSVEFYLMRSLIQKVVLSVFTLTLYIVFIYTEIQNFSYFRLKFLENFPRIYWFTSFHFPYFQLDDYITISLCCCNTWTYP